VVAAMAEAATVVVVRAEAAMAAGATVVEG